MRSHLIRLILLVISDIIVAMVLLFFYYQFHAITQEIFFILLGLMGVLIFGRAVFFFSGNWFFFQRKLRDIRDIINGFKKGKFIIPPAGRRPVDEYDEIREQLVVVGRHLDSIMSSQKREIDNFIELYNSIIFSISAYFIVLGENDEIVFANEGFCRKFQFQLDDLYSKRIDDIFYFVNARLKGGIARVRETGRTEVLEKTHLLTENKVSVIADVKISNIVIKDVNQIIIIIDDVSNKLRSDYQISLMSQISESIRKDDEIDRVLFTILTGVTSGAGLGFNRAMLFLVEDEHLVGKMAVGPDTLEEAIEIWSSVSTSGEITAAGKGPVVMTAGINLFNKVCAARFPLNDPKNLICRALESGEVVHVHDAWNDARVDPHIREFMDVNEFVLVPMIVVNKRIGLIAADNKFNNAPITRETIELLTIFASQSAMSIESYLSLDVVQSEMRKLAQRQDAIVESEKLAAVGRIASHLAHEIRNPLVTMGGYARRIIQLPKEKTKNSAKIDASAEIILRECERLEKTLSNVMDFSRPAKFIKEFNSMNEVVNDTVELLRNMFFEKRIDVKLMLSPELPLVKSDFNQMKQVMLNLLQNAIDATPVGGVVTVSTKSEDDVVVITVSDTGRGFDMPDPSVVFEPFFTTKVTGVGLGLAIVRKIIKDHEGTIQAYNRKEGGAEFVIRLPLPG